MAKRKTKAVTPLASEPLDYTKVPVSVSNQKALWQKATDTFADAAASDEDFMSYMGDVSLGISIYIAEPATDEEFLAYVFS